MTSIGNNFIKPTVNSIAKEEKLEKIAEEVVKEVVEEPTETPEALKVEANAADLLATQNMVMISKAPTPAPAPTQTTVHTLKESDDNTPLKEQTVENIADTLKPAKNGFRIPKWLKALGEFVYNAIFEGEFVITWRFTI